MRNIIQPRCAAEAAANLFMARLHCESIAETLRSEPVIGPSLRAHLASMADRVAALAASVQEYERGEIAVDLKALNTGRCPIEWSRACQETASSPELNLPR